MIEGKEQWLQKYYIENVTPIHQIKIWDPDCKKIEEHLTMCRDTIKNVLNYLACPDKISEMECNEQLAFNELRKCLEELEK